MKYIPIIDERQKGKLVRVELTPCDSMEQAVQVREDYLIGASVPMNKSEAFRLERRA